MAATDKPKLDADRKWRYMIPISHQFYIYGRKAAGEILGQGEVEKFIERFWRINGEDTGRMYLELGKLDPSDLPGLVRAIARSSEIMGEDAEARNEGSRSYLIHHSCPWPATYKESDLPESCQSGCDVWFKSLAAAVSSRICVKTTRSIAAGEGLCVREFWIEQI